MNLRNMVGLKNAKPPEAGQPEPPPPERFLTLLAEGTAMNALEIDTASYTKFREIISKQAMQLADRLPNAEKLALLQNILHEFERYRGNSENLLRERISGWRALVAKLLSELLDRMGVDPSLPEAATLQHLCSSLLTGEEIHAFMILLADFLRMNSIDSKGTKVTALKTSDRSTANLNATGLRGGGAAVEHLRNIMEVGGNGYVVLFQLGGLRVIGERFGMEAIQDSLMAVSAFLTHSLRSDDAIFHWSDSALLAILRSPTTEPILTAAIRRIVDNNREITIQLDGHVVMLHVPLEFKIFSIDRFPAPEDLYKLS
jgi:GGDEF domain-containing protein